MDDIIKDYCPKYPSLSLNFKNLKDIQNNFHKDFQQDKLQSIDLNDYQKTILEYWKILTLSQSFLDDFEYQQYILHFQLCFSNLDIQIMEILQLEDRIQQVYNRLRNERNELETKFNQYDKIFVKRITGKIIPIIYETSMTVDDLKMKIQEIEGISPNQHRLVFKGKTLEEGRRLFDYGIQKDFTIHLVWRIRGGDFSYDISNKPKEVTKEQPPIKEDKTLFEKVISFFSF